MLLSYSREVRLPPVLAVVSRLLNDKQVISRTPHYAAGFPTMKALDSFTIRFETGLLLPYSSEDLFPVPFGDT